jgi:hypothetical protein
MKIEFVEQKHKYGCAVACLAMITGKTYDEVADAFEIDFDRKGMPWQLHGEYLGDQGFGVIEKVVKTYHDVAWTQKEMMKPFADAHLLSVSQFCGSKMNHAVVMTNKGKLICPNGICDADMRKGTYYIAHVLGVFEK